MIAPHPVADLFPMMAADELADLAADIAERGLLHPVVLDADGLVLDGRNRLAACELAGIDPVFVTYDGEDPAGYALASNIQRRNLTKGQTAMIAAKAVFVSNTSSASAANAVGTSRTRIEYAKTVLEYASDLVDAVIAGAMGLDAAYEKARANKTAADSEVAQLERLRAENPDLADKVIQGELTLPGAWAELAERQRKRAEEQRDARALLTRILDLTAPPSMSDGFTDSWADRLGDDLDPATVKQTEVAGHVLLRAEAQKAGG